MDAFGKNAYHCQSVVGSSMPVLLYARARKTQDTNSRPMGESLIKSYIFRAICGQTHHRVPLSYLLSCKQHNFGLCVKKTFCKKPMSNLRLYLSINSGIITAETENRKKMLKSKSQTGFWGLCMKRCH